jgi:diguanylate cyclase (GGDEF)-like protein
MSLVNRQDRMLVAGLVAALVVVFARPLRYLLDLARDVEQSSGLALVPALLILTVVFLFHLQSKGQQAGIQAAAARAEAQEAGARAAEMERLVLFGQALGRALDLDSIREIALQHLPTLAGTQEVWAMAVLRGQWHGLVGSGTGRANHAPDPSGPDAVRLRLATRVLTDEGESAGLPAIVDREFCVPISAGGHKLGVLGAPQASGALDGHRPRTLAAAATLLAIALRNAELFGQIRETSLRDGLTGCYNRTHAMEMIDVELRRARRTELPVSLIMFDLDHFKAINDQRGHLCGDAVLAAVGERMRAVLRASDLKCRYGGEEFLVLLPETAIDGARHVADSFRQELAGMAIDWQGEPLRITASFGVTAALPSEIDADAMVGRADAALYRAKAQGRNCVRLSAEPAVA